MIAAIYARKSTDQHDISDEQKSVARQIDHARQYAARKGWAVADDHVYVDDGISGAEFANRPAFLRMMNTLKPRPPFQVLVMSEESRLGRESIETAYSLKQLVTAGVRVFFYLEDRERTLETPTDKIMLSLTAFADELERDKARQRTIDAMQRKARAGHVTGGACFGYDNVDVMSAERDKSGRLIRSHVTRRVNEAEASVVRQIFEMYAQGIGKLSIARRLNEQHAIAPRAQRARPRGWCCSSVYSVLHRDLYRGLIVYNRTRKRNAWGQKKQSDRSQAEWIQVEAPELRIVSEDLWNAAHRRLNDTRKLYLRGTDGQLWGRPVHGADAKYLLAGMLACARCGGNLDVRSRSHGTRRAHFYSCSTYIRKGKAICPDELLAPMPALDDHVLSWFERELLDPEVLEAAFARALGRHLERGQSLGGVRAQLRDTIGELDAEIDRLTNVIAEGGHDVAALLAGLRARQRRREDAQRELRQVEAQAASRRATPAADLKRVMRDALNEWRGTLHAHVPQARQILRKLLKGRITVATEVKNGQRGWVLRAEGTFEKLFAYVLPDGFSQVLASPTGGDSSETPGPVCNDITLETWFPAA